MRRRHERYNEQWALVSQLEKEGKALVLRPHKDLGVTRYTTDPVKLRPWFQLGYDETFERLDEIRKFMEQCEITKDTKGAIIIYDLTKEHSYNIIDSCYEKLKAKFGINLPFMIIGNKNDLVNLRNVDEDEAYEKAVQYNCDYCETSCIEDEGEKGNKFNQSEYYNTVRDAINLLIARIYYKTLPEAEKNSLEKLAANE